MMMPANFSVMAENELTYVVGGSAVTDFAKTLNTNIVTIVGNSYVSKLVYATLGTMFSGNWGNDLTFADRFKLAYPKNMNGFNKFMQVVGTGAAIYQLGTTSTGILNEKTPKWDDTDPINGDNKVKHYFTVKGWTSDFKKFF